MFRSFVWDFVGKAGAQLSAFIVSIFLTRLLQPEEYGVMGMAMVIIAISNVFVNLGFSNAIVQQQNISHEQTSTVFFLNMLIGCFVFVVCFTFSGSLASFYKISEIKPVFRALSFLFIINSLNIVPSALLYKDMNFRLISIINIIGTVSGGVLGIFLAFQGYGVWSLVAQSLLSSIAVFILTQAQVRFFPLLVFNLNLITPLWKYGSKIFASGIIDTIFTRMDIFVIGKLFAPATLGLYTRAQTLEAFVRQLSSGSISSVMFPYISRNQGNYELVKSKFISYLNLILLASIGLSGLLYLCAEDIFIFLFSDKWVVSGKYFKIMAIAAFVWPVSNLMCTTISALGNSKDFLRLELIKKSLYLPVYSIGFIWGIDGFLYCLVCSFYISLLINMIFLNRQIQFSVRRQSEVIFKYFLVGLLSILITLFINKVFQFRDVLILRLFFTTIEFSLAYALLTYFLKLPAFEAVQSFLIRMKKTKK